MQIGNFGFYWDEGKQIIPGLMLIWALWLVGRSFERLPRIIEAFRQFNNLRSPIWNLRSSVQPVRILSYLIMAVSYAAIYCGTVYAQTFDNLILTMSNYSDDNIAIIIDRRTGVRIGIPKSIARHAETFTWGSQWKAIDGRINIGAMRLTDRKLDDLYFGLKNKRGRRLSLDTFSKNSFILEGSDQNQQSFYVAAVERDGEIRGISITYENWARDELRDVLKEIIKSFDPFPSPVTQPSASDDRIAELERQLNESRKREALLKQQQQEARSETGPKPEGAAQGAGNRMTAEEAKKRQQDGMEAQPNLNGWNKKYSTTEDPQEYLTKTWGDFCSAQTKAAYNDESRKILSALGVAQDDFEKSMNYVTSACTACYVGEHKRRFPAEELPTLKDLMTEKKREADVGFDFGKKALSEVSSINIFCQRVFAGRVEEELVRLKSISR